LIRKYLQSLRPCWGWYVCMSDVASLAEPELHRSSLETFYIKLILRSYTGSLRSWSRKLKLQVLRTIKLWGGGRMPLSSVYILVDTKLLFSDKLRRVQSYDNLDNAGERRKNRPSWRYCRDYRRCPEEARGDTDLPKTWWRISRWCKDWANVHPCVAENLRAGKNDRYFNFQRRRISLSVRGAGYPK